MAAVFEAGRAACDLVVVDAGRAGDQAVEVALATATRALLLAPTRLCAAIAAQVVATTARSRYLDLRLVVRTTAPGRLSAAQLTNSLQLLDELAERLRSADVRSQPRLHVDTDSIA